MPTKYIIVTGGVLSGLGKGIAAASIGHLLSSKLKIIPIKCDGYLNVDPGTMNPFEHGEVFVLDDGGEVDMDFGHYERFLGVNCKSQWNLTMGKVFDMVRQKERRGDYLGKTVQYIPHVTDVIKNHVFSIAKEEKADLVIVEIGGTVGDIENELFLEAMRQMKEDVGRENIVYVHLTYVPIPYGVNEQKSKPTQQSVNLLKQRGIFPDVIIGRCSRFLTKEIKAKISNFCDVDPEAVITGLDVEDVYEIPIIFEQEGLAGILHKKLNIYSPPDLRKWKELIDNLRNPKREITVAMCGKYTRLEDSYASIIESFNHCAAHLGCKINLKWVETTDLRDAAFLDEVDGIVVPGGFGSRGTEGKIEVIRLARERNIPFLGLCLGLHMAVIEFARNVCKLEGANSTEMDPSTPHPVIDILPEQREIREKGGTMRLGAYEAVVVEGTLVHALYQAKEISERHRHRYEVNPAYHEILQDHGMVFSASSKDGRLVEFIELPDHKYFVATQAHPELKSRMDKPSPLFYGFVKACLEGERADRENPAVK
ncbi:MAG: CTP synthase (glutamine hydrolyzing) [Deltaproteobacteria bacterium]|nr:CTP synthase (glutamine hydrolyzing) [Deltaproteobacteria bacterium]MBW2017193.1 CTP synthase (glutamine hydrolyzing) [Deltaproteobacteria bacterium]MBW2129265.1 CTP synthase (glutamine hydrolyzing) [Deltaproteobacteria bacterium]MBW2303967.1 CTP synthase (glutamine hydrolyzing) [Deltaproteobacteria bacterium]